VGVISTGTVEFVGEPLLSRLLGCAHTVRDRTGRPTFAALAAILRLPDGRDYYRFAWKST
jgi:hypothetical protein